MNGRPVDVPPEILDHAPVPSPEIPLKVAAAQMACSRSLDENVARAVGLVREAAAEGADVVVLPELALTGALDEDVEAARAAQLEAALAALQRAARAAGIAAVAGLPWIEGEQRFNCAVAIGPDGALLTRYAQLAVDRPQLFAVGTSTRAMWCEIKGVPTVLTVGRDALWSELAELAVRAGPRCTCTWPTTETSRRGRPGGGASRGPTWPTTAR